MSKSPDLSAFPIPRKGVARPIGIDELPETDLQPQEKAGEGAQTVWIDTTAAKTRSADSAAAYEPDRTPKRPDLPPIIRQAPAASVSGQVVATTVKLDESRYLRLVNAGQPGPGRLKRRTIQEMMVEAIDEWFDRRGL